MFGGIIGYARRLTSFDFLRSNARITRDFLDASVAGEHEYSSETFEGAVERLGLDEKAIARRRFELDIQAKTCFIVGLLVLVYGFWHLTAMRDHLEVILALGTFAFSSVPFSLFIKNSFRVWQIRERRLGAFSEWVAKPGEWLKS